HSPIRIQILQMGSTTCLSLRITKRTRIGANIPRACLRGLIKGFRLTQLPSGWPFFRTAKRRSRSVKGSRSRCTDPDRSRKTGYKVIFFPWQGGRPRRQIDLVTGWLDDRSQSQWGRPVDVKPANDGSVLISDDYSGTIYRLAPLRGP